MNHFMLPSAGRSAPARSAGSMRYGTYAMSVLIKALEAGGAQRERLEAKVFGGAAVLGELPMGRIGEANARFVLDYLAAHQIPVAAQDLGDRYPRYLRYYPATGLAQVKRYKRNPESLVARERALAATLTRAQRTTEAPAWRWAAKNQHSRR
jgi:chemotaxis protein CheD